MSSPSTNNDGRKAEILNIAVSTDTILYTPFFLAYYSGDFEDTPFGKLSVNIIGSQDDSRFIQSQKLKGDGFATFCMLFNLADAAICDPSFLVYLQCSGNLKTEFAKFEQLLTMGTKESLVEKDSIYNDYVELRDGVLTIKHENTFKSLFSNKKVIGGLISKIAFSVVGSPDLEAPSNKDSYKGEKFSKIDKRTVSRPFTKIEVKGKFIYYKTPSTGCCIGDIYATTYNKFPDDTLGEDFGFEIARLSDYSSSIAITCDFVTLDYFLNKDQSNGEKKIVEIERLAEESKPYMFTAIQGNCEPRNMEKLKALLYGIDKNLYYIHHFLKHNDTTGLTKYFKKKFNYSKSKEADLLELLVGDAKCRMEIKKMIDNESAPLFTFDTIIRYYVNRLDKCKMYGGLYFSTTAPDEEALRNMIALRYESIGDSFPLNKDLQPFLQNDLLIEWRKTEQEYIGYENKINALQLKESKKDALVMLASPVMVCRPKLRARLLRKLWLYISKPSYLYIIGSMFLIFELVSSLFHIAGYHITLSHLAEGMQDKMSADAYKLLHSVAFWVDLGIFLYLILITFVLVLETRKLLKLRENYRYIYRYE